MNITHSVEIASPPEVVWEYINDVEKQPLWMKGLQSTEVTNDKTGVGATFKMKIKEGRKVGEYEGEVLAYEELRHLGVKFQSCVGSFPPMHVDYHLTDLGGSTRLDYKCSCEVKSLGWKIMSVLFSWIAKIQVKSFFKTLKRLAEDEAHAAAPA